MIDTVVVLSAQYPVADYTMVILPYDRLLAVMVLTGHLEEIGNVGEVHHLSNVFDLRNRRDRSE